MYILLIWLSGFVCALGLVDLRIIKLPAVEELINDKFAPLNTFGYMDDTEKRAD